MSDTTRGLPGLGCPGCAEKDNLTVRVSDGALHCIECGDVWPLEEVRAIAKGWWDLVRWMEALPVCNVEGK